LSDEEHREGLVADQVARGWRVVVASPPWGDLGAQVERSGAEHVDWTAGRAPGPGYGHVALHANGKAGVDAAHRAGLANGGRDDGPPGPRPQYGRRYYAAYLRDPDGLRVEVVSRR